MAVTMKGIWINSFVVTVLLFHTTNIVLASDTSPPAFTARKHQTDGADRLNELPKRSTDHAIELTIDNIVWTASCRSFQTSLLNIGREDFTTRTLQSALHVKS